MPTVKAKFQVNYERQGSGDPLILIPYLAADHACYAFQVAEFSKHFTCFTPDLRGTGETDNPPGDFSIETLADDVSDFMDALGIARAHFFGLSLGTGVGLWLGAKYPHKVRSLSLHGAWTKTDQYLKTVIQSWQAIAKGLGSVQETVIHGIFPWCLTPALYASNPGYIQSLADFVRSRPPLPTDSFLRQTEAVLRHDVEAQLPRNTAPTQVTVGRFDMVTPLHFAQRIKRDVRDCELFVFEECSHAALYERVDEFNKVVLEFLEGRAAAVAA